MAFLFNGTFSRAQVDLLVTWVQQQIPNIDARINHLLARMRRVGFLKMEFDAEGYPVSYQPMFSGSLMEKLIGAYEAQGGDLARDFRLRMHNQKVSHARASIQQGGSTKTTDGANILSANMDDVISGDTIAQLKKPFIEVMKRKRGLIEHRIKTTQDLYDRLNTEVVLLKLAKYQPAGLTVDPGEGVEELPTSGSLSDLKKAIEAKTAQAAIDVAKGEVNEGEAFETLAQVPEGSVAQLVTKIQTILANNTDHRAAQDTTPHDIFGLKVKPLLGFDESVRDLGSTGTQLPPATAGKTR